jgi:hypothetical protein
VTLPKPVTSGLEARGRFGKQDFVYLGDEDAYRCPAGEKLTYHYTNEENGQQLRRYWTDAAATVHSKPAVRRARSGGLRAGNMSTFWKGYRGASTTNRRPCGSGGRQSNIRSAR